MKAIPLARTKELREDGTIIEVVIWQTAEPLLPCVHPYKYRLYYGNHQGCRVRYDNERGKGDHRHVAGREFDYEFTTLEQLLEDFETDIDRWGTE